MYGRIVLGVPGEEFDSLLTRPRSWPGPPTTPASRSSCCATWSRPTSRSSSATPAALPPGPRRAAAGAIEAVFASWNGPRAIAYRVRERIAHDLGTAVNVQAMVFGNRDNDSGTGVGFTRDPATGAVGEYGDFLVNAQGEDVVAGIRNTEPLSALADEFPKIHKELLAIFGRLERHYRDMCDTEFTIEQGKLWMLQTRVGKRTGRAALRMAVDMVSERAIKLTEAEAVGRVTGEHLDRSSIPSSPPTATGAGHGPGRLARRGGRPGLPDRRRRPGRRRAGRGRGARPQRDLAGGRPRDAGRRGDPDRPRWPGQPRSRRRPGLGQARRGGRRGPAHRTHSFRVGDVEVLEGDWISVDGTNGVVVLGQVAGLPGRDAPRVRDHPGLGRRDPGRPPGVRANADNGPDATNARQPRRRGHRPVPDRAHVPRRGPPAGRPPDDPGRHPGRGGAGPRGPAGGPEGRLLRDPRRPWTGCPSPSACSTRHCTSSSPTPMELAIKEATVGLTDEESKLFEAAKHWHEFNPMLGTRGVRLGVIKPGLYAMQVRALMEAALDRVDAGGHPIVEIMIPLTVSRVRNWPSPARGSSRPSPRRWPRRRPAGQEGAKDTGRLEVLIGTMIETPRAALRAGEIAEEADFFSFGTNDLTQMTFGFSRDDVEGRMMSAYLEQGLLKRNPFEVVDPDGVGELVRLGYRAGPGDPARPEDRRLRRARRRPRVDRHLLPPGSTT